MGSPIEVRLLPELPDSNGEFYFRRISIVGGSGAGKSSLALRLGGIMKSRVVHLDKEFFLPGWTKPLLKDWKDKVSQLTSGESWVIEGNYFDVMAARIERSTMFIFLDTPLHERLWGNVRRTLSWLGRVRPDTGQVERLSLRHIANAYGYMKRRSMDFADLERRCGEGGVPWVRLTSRRETEALVNSLKSASVGPWPPS